MTGHWPRAVRQQTRWRPWMNRWSSLHQLHSHQLCSQVKIINSHDRHQANVPSDPPSSILLSWHCSSPRPALSTGSLPWHTTSLDKFKVQTHSGMCGHVNATCATTNYRWVSVAPWSGVDTVESWGTDECLLHNLSSSADPSRNAPQTYWAFIPAYSAPPTS